MADEHTLLLGEIKGKLDTLIDAHHSHAEKLDSIDGRLRHVERKTVMHGAAYGALASVGMAILIEKIKRNIGI